MSLDTLRNQRILITGATGFVGSNLLKRLTALRVPIFKNSIDILDYDRLFRYVAEQRITSCVHLAGLSTVEDGYETPGKTFRTNIQGTINVLECARALNLERIIIASTVHVYGSQPPPYRESSPLFPTRPYETSKTCADMIAQSYATTFNLPVLIPRFVNIYGPGDLHPERLIPKTIQSLLHHSTETLWGGSIERDYIFIDDAVEAYLRLLHVGLSTIGPNRAINIGTGGSVSVRVVMEMIARILDIPLTLGQPLQKRPHEVASQAVSITKAQTILSWTPRIDLEQGLKQTIPWYIHTVRAKASEKIRSQV